MTELFNSAGIDIFGVCGFSRISGGLLQCRAISRLPEKPESVICALFPYNMGDYENRSISRYACVADYHIIVMNALEKICAALGEKYPGNSFVPFVDNSPIPEVHAAALAGLGCVGENGLLINEKYGSWVFIGTIVTDMRFEETGGEVKSCLRCGLCKRACPNMELNKDLCLSKITQRKGELTADEQKLMIEYNTAWGCDVCQEVCPMNKNAVIEPFKGFLDFPVINCLEMENDGMRAYNYRGKKVISRNISYFFDLLF